MKNWEPLLLGLQQSSQHTYLLRTTVIDLPRVRHTQQPRVGVLELEVLIVK